MMFNTGRYDLFKTEKPEIFSNEHGWRLEEKHLEDMTNTGLNAIVSDWLGEDTIPCMSCRSDGREEVRECGNCKDGKLRVIYHYTRDPAAYHYLFGVLESTLPRFSYEIVEDGDCVVDFNTRRLSHRGRVLRCDRLKRAVVRTAAVLWVNLIGPQEPDWKK